MKFQMSFMLIFIGIDLFKIYISYEKYKIILKNIDFYSDINGYFISFYGYTQVLKKIQVFL